MIFPVSCAAPADRSWRPVLLMSASQSRWIEERLRYIYLELSAGHGTRSFESILNVPLLKTILARGRRLSHREKLQLTPV